MSHDTGHRFLELERREREGESEGKEEGEEGREGVKVCA